MLEINDKDLMKIAGGVSFSASLVSAISRAFSYIYTIGQSAGSTVRRMLNGSYCSL